VSVVVPVHRGGKEFEKCLEGIARLSPPAGELVVALDGEDDGSGAAALARGARVTRLPVRSGPAAARNAGARLATGDILLFLDADVVPAPAVVGQVRAEFEQAPDLSALIGSYDDAPGDPGFLSQYRNLLHHYTHQAGREQASTFWGACGAVRREDFWAAGGFDESILIPAMEDVELGYRLAASGRRILLAKHIQVKHLKRWGAAGMLRTDIFQRAIPWSRLLLREGRIRNDLNLDVASRLSAASAWGGGAASLPAALAWPWALWAGLACGAALLALNAGLYRFFWRKRGLLFALGALPWHWLYFLYASASFAYVRLAENGVAGAVRRNPGAVFERNDLT
jgi:glycosyltransferase involved in cell wall biosynthesis